METTATTPLDLHLSSQIMQRLKVIGEFIMREQKGDAGACQAIAKAVQDQLGYPRQSVYFQIAPHEYWAHEVNIPFGKPFVLGETPIIDAGSLRQVNGLLAHFQQKDQEGNLLQIAHEPLVINPGDALYSRFVLAKSS